MIRRPLLVVAGRPGVRRRGRHRARRRTAVDRRRPSPPAAAEESAAQPAGVRPAGGVRRHVRRGGVQPALLTGDELAGRTVAVVADSRGAGRPARRPGRPGRRDGCGGVGGVRRPSRSWSTWRRARWSTRLGASSPSSSARWPCPRTRRRTSGSARCWAPWWPRRAQGRRAGHRTPPTIEQSLASAGLVTCAGGAPARAAGPGGPRRGRRASPTPTRSLAGLVAGLAGTARAVVVAGSAATAEDGHVLAQLREAPQPTSGPTRASPRWTAWTAPAGRVTAALAWSRSFTERRRDLRGVGLRRPRTHGVGSKPVKVRAHEACVRHRRRRLQSRQGPHRLQPRAACSRRAVCASRCRSSTPTSTSTPGR